MPWSVRSVYSLYQITRCFICKVCAGTVSHIWLLSLCIEEVVFLQSIVFLPPAFHFVSLSAYFMVILVPEYCFNGARSVISLLLYSYLVNVWNINTVTSYVLVSDPLRLGCFTIYL